MGEASFAPVLGFPKYTVCSDGTVYGWKYAKPLKSKTTPWGYHELTLADRGRSRTAKVHTLVLEAFVGPRPAGTEAAHMDGNATNNDVANLTWTTHADNIVHKAAHGTKVYGERFWSAKLTVAKVRELRRRYIAGESARSLANEFGTGRHSAWRAATGRTWKHVA